jgi:hypothetical protein
MPSKTHFPYRRCRAIAYEPEPDFVVEIVRIDLFTLGEERADLGDDCGGCRASW